MLRRGENVRATVIGSDETKSPLLVERLNFARRHASLLGFKIAEDFRADPALFCNRSSRPQGRPCQREKGKVTRLARAGARHAPYRSCLRTSPIRSAPPPSIAWRDLAAT